MYVCMYVCILPTASYTFLFATKVYHNCFITSLCPGLYIVYSGLKSESHISLFLLFVSITALHK